MQTTIHTSPPASLAAALLRELPARRSALARLASRTDHANAFREALAQAEELGRLAQAGASDPHSKKDAPALLEEIAAAWRELVAIADSHLDKLRVLS